MPESDTRIKKNMGHFLSGLKTAIGSRLSAGGPVEKALERCFSGFSLDSVSLNRPEPGRSPACRHLEAAFSNAGIVQPDLKALIESFKTFEPLLVWEKPHRSHASNEPEAEGDHDFANTFFVGPGRLIPSKQLLVGATIMGPNTLYPDHKHPPEEIYLSLSRGAWRQNDGPWNEPGIGGLIYNPPGIVHAMRADREPFFAFWCLPLP